MCVCVCVGRTKLGGGDTAQVEHEEGEVLEEEGEDVNEGTWKGRKRFADDDASAEGRGEEPERVSHTSSPTIMAVTDANGQKVYPCR